MTAAEIAQATGGRLIGDGAVRVTGVASLGRAGAGELSFLATARYAHLMADASAGILLVSPDLQDVPGTCLARVVVDAPYDALVALLPRFFTPIVHAAGIHPAAHLGERVTLGEGVCIEAGAVIGDGAVIGARAWIAPYAVLGAGTTIGDDCQIYPHVFTYPDTQIGHRCIVHSGARLGSDGYGYRQAMIEGQLVHVKIPHLGRVIIGDDVEIGANCTIDRGMVDDTTIGAGTKLDNLVQVGHNARIGRACLIMSQVGISGSVHVEDGALVAGQAGLAGHLTIGKGARVAAQAGVISDVPAGETWSGYPARPHKESLRATAALFKLPALLRRIEQFLDRDTP
ncbi:MAG: UDP-3-O-(3-hydroxymyristoyl)glucosamine N-acyltransferase [Gemmatimonadaceae bacterium]